MCFKAVLYLNNSLLINFPYLNNSLLINFPYKKTPPTNGWGCLE
ncbi:hypothetical protein J596_4330 [Acinetobacter baumannii 21072]|uniref:Uncharacterized protein n=1 Tax=Acinetobacter baumannii 21072 TaxID=1310697 RepID=A0A062HHU0_ACIBA|nr:hypothetical protein J596_4330 [Acinetobacter baumannii 21072]